MSLLSKIYRVYLIEKYRETKGPSPEFLMVSELLCLRDMEQALNPQDVANDQPINTRVGSLYSRISDRRGAAMMTVFPIVLFLTFLGLAGCDSHSEKIWDEVVLQSKQAKAEQPTKMTQPESVLIQNTNFPNEEALVEQDTSEIQTKPGTTGVQEFSSAEKSSSLGRYLAMDSKLYLTKSGELFGDLTIRNHNHVSVNQITVHCVEYNMNHTPIREAEATWSKILRPGESGYWDQANFGYVHHDFDTVNCDIVNADLS